MGCFWMLGVVFCLFVGSGSGLDDYYVTARGGMLLLFILLYLVAELEDKIEALTKRVKELED